MAFDWSSAKTKADYKSLTYEDIEKYCQENNRVDWLINAAERLEANKNRKRAWGIIQLRALFIEEVLGITSKPAPKPKTMYNRIMQLKHE